MKVILAQDVRSLGKVGDLVKVADGYARNFLIPRKLAIAATERRIKEFKHLQAMAEAKKKKAQSQAQQVAARLSALSIRVTASAGEGDKLFGSVTTAEIAHKISDQGFTIDKRDVVLDEPIKQLGQYRVIVKVATGVEAQVKVTVARE
jgi:large subunit ribosomal protein L9